MRNVIAATMPFFDAPSQMRRRSFADRKSTRLNSSHTDIPTLFPTRRSSDLRIGNCAEWAKVNAQRDCRNNAVLRCTEPDAQTIIRRSEEHTSELQSHGYSHSFPYTALFRSQDRQLCRVGQSECAT